MPEQRISELPNSARDIFISRNPKAGSKNTRQTVLDFQQKLTEKGFNVQLVEDLGLLETKVNKSLNSGALRTIVAAGGDGTVSLLAEKYAPRVPIAILPLGTENLMAKYLGVHGDTDKLVRSIVDGVCCRLDSGVANGKIFLVMASVGFDADVVERMHRSRTGHIRHWSYIRPMIDAISNYRFPKLSVSPISRQTNGQDSTTDANDNHQSIAAKWAFVFNVPRYAMQLRIVDDADPTDGLLDYCTFRGGSLFNVFKYLVGVLARNHRKWQETTVGRASKIRIESKEDNVPFQLDGDPGGVLPVEIETLTAHLNLVVPKSWLKSSPLAKSDHSRL